MPGRSRILAPGATRGYKEAQTSEAALEIVFYENEKRIIGNTACIKVEFDMEYRRDPAAHVLIQSDRSGGGLTDPRVAYLLRWMAGRRAGVPEFAPAYTLVDQ